MGIVASKFFSVRHHVYRINNQAAIEVGCCITTS